MANSARRLATLAASGLLASWVRVAGASDPPMQTDLEFVADPAVSTDPGVLTSLSLSRILFRYDDALRGPGDAHESTVAERAEGVAGRAAKVLFIDAPLAATMMTISHELFGHGARAREQGLDPTFSFRLVEPYRTILGQGDGFLGEARFERAGQSDRDLPLVFGGIEADYRAAYFLQRRFIQQRGWVHYGDMLLYAAARLSYASSLLNPGGPTEADNDVRNYVQELQKRFNRWGDRDRESIEGQLRTAYVWNLLDPTLAYALYAVTWEHIVHGRRMSQAPLPSVGDTVFYPWKRFNLTPFGAEHYLELFVLRDGVLLDVYGRAGSSRLAAYHGGGARVRGLEVAPRLSVGAGVDAWVQPETLLHDRGVFDRELQTGGNVEGEGVVALTDRLGFTVKLAYKTRGYLAGQPLDEGAYGYAGFTLRDEPADD